MFLQSRVGLCGSSVEAGYSEYGHRAAVIGQVGHYKIGVVGV